MTVSTRGSKYLSTPSDETSFLISMKARSCLGPEEYAVLLTLELHFVFVEYNAFLLFSFHEFGQVSVIIIIIIIIIINIYIAPVLFISKRFTMLQKFCIKNKKSENDLHIYTHSHKNTMWMIHIQMCGQR